MWKRRDNNADQGGSGASPDSTILSPGATAPDFTLPDEQGQHHRLADYRRRPVILAFYPGDWSPVCSDQLVLYNEVLDMFAEYRARLLAISVDGIWSHRAFAEQRSLNFPLLSDFEPKGAVSRQYGAYNPQQGTSRRALFVIDGLGQIRWSYQAPEGVNPGADGILRALDQLKEGER